MGATGKVPARASRHLCVVDRGSSHETSSCGGHRCCRTVRGRNGCGGALRRHASGRTRRLSAVFRGGPGTHRAAHQAALGTPRKAPVLRRQVGPPRRAQRTPQRRCSEGAPCDDGRAGPHRFRPWGCIDDVPLAGCSRSARPNRGAIRSRADHLHVPSRRGDRRQRPAVPARQRQCHRFRRPCRPQAGGGAMADRQPPLRRRHDVCRHEPHPCRHWPPFRDARLGQGGRSLAAASRLVGQ
jgi:hypothetical protein